MTRWLSFAVVAALVVGLGAIYAPHRSAGFVYEDGRWNDAYGPSTSLPSPVVERPISRWAWWAQAQVAPSAFAFHAVNLGLHALAGILVWMLLARLGASAGATWLGTAMFLLNAMQIESVAYAAGRSELLAAIGVLAACVLVAGALTPSAIGAAVLAGVFGFFAKESAVVVAALAFLIAGLWRSALAATVLTAAVVGAAAIALTGQAVAPWTWMVLQGSAVYRLAFLAVLPIGHTVDFDYARVAMPVQVMTCAAVLWAVVWAWRARRRHALVAMGAVWIAITMVPRVIVETPVSPLNDHQFYLAMVGISLIVAGWVDGPRDSRAFSVTED